MVKTKNKKITLKKQKSKKDKPKKSKQKTSFPKRLVNGFIPPIPRDFLELDFFKKDIKKMLKGNSGLYVLYNKEKLYYVGMTSKDLFRRLSSHTKNKHKKNWNKFSVFIIKKSKDLKDIETITHSISEPPANVWKGRFKEHYKYDKEIKQIVKRASKFIDDFKKNK